MSYNPSDAFRDAIALDWGRLEESIRERLIYEGVDHKQILQYLADIEAVVTEIEEYLDATKVEDFPRYSRLGGMF